jgi:pyruvate kinase
MDFPRRTKIIATIGPATDNDETLAGLIDAGMNIARLNMSHASRDQAMATAERVRRVAEAAGQTVGVLMDTQGPAIRTGELPVELNLNPGDIIALTVRGETCEEYQSVDVNYAQLVDDISVDDVVVVDNGFIKLKVLEKQHNRLNCEVLTEGTLGSRRHINLPGVRVNLPALTDKDLADIEVGIQIGVDFFAMSFVREAQDVQKLRGILDYHKVSQKIIAKIENQEGVKNIEEIIAAADGIMIARGDLGIEVPFEELPPMQRRIVKKCVTQGCPVIVATHMLESMISSPSPTRAEVTDVANAVYEQTDAIMLSGETSIGKYPIECVQIMDRIARRIERSGGAGFAERAEVQTTGAKLVKAAAAMARSMEAKALVVFTEEGLTASNAAWARPGRLPIYAFTCNPTLLPQLTIHWGTQARLIDFYQDPNQRVDAASKQLLTEGLVKPGDKVVYVTEATIRGKVVETIQLEEIG